MKGRMGQEMRILITLILLVFEACETSGDLRSMHNCVQTGVRCALRKPCCRNNDICLTSPNVDSDSIVFAKCITWSNNLALFPTIANGDHCAESWQCANQCCEEHYPPRGARFFICGRPYNHNHNDWETCVTNISFT